MSYRLWLELNRPRLIAAFHRAFGQQMQEWPDFVEHQYQKSLAPD